MQLQQDEHHILSSNNDRVILTSRRICGQYKEWGHSSKIYIYLEDISSIQTVYRSNIFFVYLAVLTGLLGIVLLMQDNNQGGASGTFIATAVLFILWWVTRQRIISITPNGGKPLQFEAKAMREDAITDFLEMVQVAKTARINERYKLH